MFTYLYTFYPRIKYFFQLFQILFIMDIPIFRKWCIEIGYKISDINTNRISFFGCTVYLDQWIFSQFIFIFTIFIIILIVRYLQTCTCYIRIHQIQWFINIYFKWFSLVIEVGIQVRSVYFVTFIKFIITELLILL
jgi:hypothetical protein